MNWYSRFKLSQQEDQNIQNSGYTKDFFPKSYLDIGHDEANCDSWLWVFNNNKLEVEKADPNSLHSKIWPNPSSMWTGRYDDCTKGVSILPPYDGPKRMPSILRRMLEQKFPQAIDFFIFDHDFGQKAQIV